MNKESLTIFFAGESICFFVFVKVKYQHVQKILTKEASAYRIGYVSVCVYAHLCIRVFIFTLWICVIHMPISGGLHTFCVGCVLEFKQSIKIE